jgi:hypothetical protein
MMLRLGSETDEVDSVHGRVPVIDSHPFSVFLFTLSLSSYPMSTFDCPTRTVFACST